MQKRFTDKVVVITGASRGIGRATAFQFALEGASVVVNYCNAELSADEVVSKISGLGGKATAIKCDVSEETEVKEMFKKVKGVYGGVDIIINNAGIVYDTPLLDKTVEQWRRTLNVNLIGTFLCSKYGAQEMKERGGGSIVNISSTNGINTLSTEAADYDASKAGVISLTKNLAEELAPFIRVNSVAPGWVKTEINKDLPEKTTIEETKRILVNRFAEPEEIAKVIAFLASDDASFITGSILVVDGGYKG